MYIMQVSVLFYVWLSERELMVRGLLGENALVSCPRLRHIQIIYFLILEIMDLLLLPHMYIDCF